MARLLRSLCTLVALVLALVLPARPALARGTPELVETPSAAGAASVGTPSPGLSGGASASGPVPLPHDVPVVSAALRDTIPPVPSSYETRNLGWLRISYPPAAHERVEPLLREAPAIKAQLSEALGQSVLEHVEVRIAPTTADMARLGPPDAPPPPYASGVSYNGLHFVMLSMMAPRGADAVDLDEVLRHELAHVALEDAVQGHHVPLWFNEGLAISLSGEHGAARMQTMWNATVAGTLIPLSDLDRSFPRDSAEVSIAYAQSADLMRFLRRDADSVRFASLISRVREGEPFDRAITHAYGSDLRKLEFQWRSEAERRYSVIPILTGGGLIWVAVIVVLVAAYVRRRRRTKAILARWEHEEAIEDALIQRAQTEERDSLVRIGAPISRAPAKVEHEGRWHTLH